MGTRGKFGREELDILETTDFLGSLESQIIIIESSLTN
jgi:hypothetical protein